MGISLQQRSSKHKATNHISERKKLLEEK